MATHRVTVNATNWVIGRPGLEIHVQTGKKRLGTLWVTEGSLQWTPAHAEDEDGELIHEEAITVLPWEDFAALVEKKHSADVRATQRRVEKKHGR
ncbi:MAG: hypothetical protein WD690_13930 [Vicinamibacterales bacterium]